MGAAADTDEEAGSAVLEQSIPVRFDRSTAVVVAAAVVGSAADVDAVLRGLDGDDGDVVDFDGGYAVPVAASYYIPRLQLYLLTSLLPPAVQGTNSSRR